MAEILVKLGHQSTLDVQFRSGDPLYAADDGHPWGSHESLQEWISRGLGAHNWPGGFLIVKVPKVPKEVFYPYLNAHPDQQRQREHGVDLTGVDTGNGFVVADFDQFKASYRSKLSGISADIKHDH